MISNVKTFTATDADGNQYKWAFWRDSWVCGFPDSNYLGINR